MILGGGRSQLTFICIATSINLNSKVIRSISMVTFLTQLHCHISFYVGNCAIGFYPDETL